MMMDLVSILKKYNLAPKGVLVAGAHWAEEHDEYLKMGIERFVYIEPCKEAYKTMVNKFCGSEPERYYEKDYICFASINNIGEQKSVGVLNFACSNTEGNEPMYVSHQNQGQSNSLLQPHLHLEQHREVVFDDAEVVKVRKLDSLLNQYIFAITPIEERGTSYDMLVMDVQGAEGMVLKGATETLKHINIVYTEVNRGETYVNNVLIEEMDELLSDFERVETHWPSPNWTWGDAIYVRKTLL